MDQRGIYDVSVSKDENAPEEYCYLLEQVVSRRRECLEKARRDGDDDVGWGIEARLPASTPSQVCSTEPTHDIKHEVRRRDDGRQEDEDGSTARKNNLWRLPPRKLQSRSSPFGSRGTASKPQANPPTSLLLHLPTELRLEIWRHVFSPPHTKARRALCLLRTNRQIYAEAFPIAVPKIRFLFRTSAAFKAHITTLQPRQLAQLNHLRVPASNLNAAKKEIAIIARLADLRHTTVTITLALPTGASSRATQIPGSVMLQDWRICIDNLTGLKGIVIDNNGFYTNFGFMCLFMQMMDLDPSKPLEEWFSACYGNWVYSLRQKKERDGDGGFLMVMDFVKETRVTRGG
jgi:hypothetical protein